MENSRDGNDSELVGRYLKGDEAALEVLVRRYLKPVYGLVYHYVGNMADAEDLTQETFVRAWRNLKKFNQSKSFKAWIFAIAKNASLDFYKKKQAIPFSNFDTENGENLIAETLADPAPLISASLEQAEQVGVITTASNKLSTKYRSVISWYHYDGLNFREIAENLNEPLNTVKSRYRRALLILKKIFVEAE